MNIKNKVEAINSWQSNRELHPYTCPICQQKLFPVFFKQHGEWLHETQGINFHEGHRYYVWPDESMSFRVGKKAASRILDGRTWDEMPEI